LDDWCANSITFVIIDDVAKTFAEIPLRRWGGHFLASG
jgi:hypothetical protein